MTDVYETKTLFPKAAVLQGDRITFYINLNLSQNLTPFN